MAESLKSMMDFFTPHTGKLALTGELAGTHRKMDAKAMIREWKALSEESKAQLRQGITDGTLTY
ncbi:MAG TPA: hypothetical protein VEM32_06525 [Geobacteraceae bacterium]|nr:hypothetical protein [Geobacteraceae bacterium]